jgi:NAD-dependent deacetylase
LNHDGPALLKKISAARHCVALTGAGISTLSGIPDFRGREGLYRDSAAFREFFAEASAPPEAAEKMFDIAYFEKDPAFFYRTAGSFIYRADEKEPAVVHRVLAELERRGFLKTVITQNIDSLHQKAGSRRVIEIHGSPRTHYCLRCPGVRMGFAEAAALVKAGELPRCPRCGRVLKPAVTFLGEALPMDARRDAEAAAAAADLMLILGTSLRIFPAADLPRAALRRGGELIIVNDGETPLDTHAVLRFKDLQDVFETLEHLLGEQPRNAALGY